MARVVYSWIPVKERGVVKGIKLYPGYDKYAINDPSLVLKTVLNALKLREEAERTVQALDFRGTWPGELELPRNAEDREPYLEDRLREERKELQAASQELEQMAQICTRVPAAAAMCSGPVSAATTTSAWRYTAPNPTRPIAVPSSTRAR